MRTTWLAAMLCVGVVGCHHHGLPPGGDGGAGDMGMDMSANEDMSTDMNVGDMGPFDGGAKLVTYSMFADDYAKALCTHYMNCGRLDAAQFDLCVENNKVLKGWDIDTEITKHRLDINELQCIVAVQALRCDDSNTGYRTSRCVAFYNIPHQSNGAACLANEECMSGYCEHSLTDAGTKQQNAGCPGMCAQPTAPGASCLVDNQCGPNAVCDSTTKTCRVWPGLGQPCDPNGDGCQIGLLCPIFDAAPKCQVGVTQTNVGGACDPTQGIYTDMPACADGMFCELQYDSSTPPKATGATCQPKLAKGTPCDPDPSRPKVGFYSSVDNQCEDGTLCYSTNGSPPTCQPYGSANDACLRSTCKAGLYCDIPANAASGTCKPLIADAQSCDPNSNRCASAKPLPFQQTCIAANPDAGTFTTCGAPKPFGASCLPGYEDSLCAGSSGANTTTCVETAGGKGVCAPKCQ